MKTKVIAFYNGKGGTGKTVLSILFASYLKYGCGARVAVADFESPNHPVKGYRERDREVLEDSSSELSLYLKSKSLNPNESWDLYEFDNSSSDHAKRDKEIERFRELVKSGKYDYVLVDFPGRLQPDGIEAYLLSKDIDLCMIPTDIGYTSRRWAYIVHATLSKRNVKHIWLWNNLSWYDNTQGPAKRIEEEYSKLYNGNSVIEFAPYRIKEFAKARRESDVKYFVVSTLCWPEENVKRYIPELIPLFEWVKAQLDESK